MKMEVMTSEQFLGDIIGNLNSRRACIDDIEVRADVRVLHCFIPLAETFGYATNIRSLSQGRATYTMEFHQYQEVPTNIAQQVVASTRGVA
jgi:elongation factor G